MGGAGRHHHLFCGLVGPVRVYMEYSSLTTPLIRVASLYSVY